MNRRTVFFGSVGILIVLLLWIFRSWLPPHVIIGGDWPYLFPSMVSSWNNSGSAWGSGYGGGLGGLSPAYFLHAYNVLSAWTYAHTPFAWQHVSFFFWFAIPLFVFAWGTWKLYATLVLKPSPLWQTLAVFIALTNTYVLMVTGGGQMGVFASISLVPWVLRAFLCWLFAPTVKDRVRQAVILGGIAGLQCALDPRIVYVTALGGLVMVPFLVRRTTISWSLVGTALLSGVMCLGINLYWVLPLFLLRENTLGLLGEAYTSSGALRFFSFADFSHSLSLLHPNWPENIFGKTYFLQPEFLLLPVMAFSWMLKTREEKKQTRELPALFGFCALALVGAFLAKGVHPPFGAVYEWMFFHIPGFVMFRDPTKFYILTGISFAMLIPYSVSVFTNTQKRPYAKYIAWGMTMALWIWCIRPAVSGTLGGTFASRRVPEEYQKLARTLEKESDFFRMMWVPRQSRFTFSSDSVLPIESQPLFDATDSATITRMFSDDSTKETLTRWAVRYIAVPTDPYSELFLDDRRYSAKKRDDVIRALSTISWLKKEDTGPIVLFRTPSARDRFWVGNDGHVSWQKVSDDVYRVSVDIKSPSVLTFSESYHPQWVLRDADTVVHAKQSADGIMTFDLARTGAYTITVEFSARRYYRTTMYLSAGVLVLGALFVSIYHEKDKKRT